MVLELALGLILLIPLVCIVIRHPIVGLYLYLLLTYLRPQDLLGFLSVLHPNLVVLGLTIIGLITHRRTAEEPRISFLRNDKIFLALLIAVLLSNFTSIWLKTSVEATIEFIKISVFYFIAIKLLNNRQRIKTYFTYYIYSVAFVSLVQIYTYFTVGVNRLTGRGGYGIIIAGKRLLGGAGPLLASAENVHGVGGYSSHFFGNASELGLGLCVAYPVSYYLFKSSKDRLHRIIFLSITGMLIFSIILTGSRGAFLALLATVAYILYKEKRLFVGLLIMTILMAGPVYYIASEKYVDRIKSIGKYENDESVNVRFQLWRAGARMIADRPVFGVGIENFSIAYGSSYRTEESASIYWSPHNIFIQIATELGLVGFTIYILFIAAIFKTNRESRHQLNNTTNSQVLLNLTSAIDVSLVGYIIAGQFITATYYPHLFQLSIWTSVIYLTGKRMLGNNHNANDIQNAAY
jgi:O-antigen ligase